MDTDATSPLELLTELRQQAPVQSTTETQLKYLRSIYGTPKKSRKRSREDTRIWREETFKKEMRREDEKD
jgi:hypothetical protein